VHDAGEVPGVLADLLADGDVVVTQGAGDIAGLARRLAGEGLPGVPS
jgi:UDP-N-acetylmuramate--alanine ligase